MHRDIQYDSVPFKLTGKLAKAGVEMDKNDRYLFKYKNLILSFTGDRDTHILNIEYPINEFKTNTF